MNNYNMKKVSISIGFLTHYSGMGLECFVVTERNDGKLDIIVPKDNSEVMAYLLLGNYFLGVKNEAGTRICFQFDLKSESIIKVIEIEKEVSNECI